MGFLTLFIVATFAFVAYGDTEHSFDNGNYNVLTHNNGNGTIDFFITVKTLGWIGIGVGPNPNMTNADIVVGGVLDNDTAYWTDMYSTRNGRPTPDNKTESDWVLLSSSQNSALNETYVAFRRLLKTDDNNAGQDYEIKNEDLHLICAYGQTDTLNYHSSSRWSTKVNLLQEGIPGENEFSFGNGAYNLKTISDANAGTIEFHVTVETLGWVGIGVGPNPNMTNADIVVGGVLDNNNTAYYNDMYAPTNGRPSPDNKTTSDWDLLSSSQNSTLNVTSMSFRRFLKTNDNNAGQDYEIKNEDLYLICAYGQSDTLSYHSTSRWFQKVNLLQQGVLPTTTENIISTTTENTISTTTGNTMTTTTPSNGGGENIFSFDNGAYNLRTFSDANVGTIEFHVTVKTLGWVGIGVGPNPNMTNADIVVGGVFDNNNTAYHNDMYAPTNGRPSPDNKTTSDWDLLSSSQNSTTNVTFMSFRRLLKTNDNNAGQDYEIKSEDLYLICAYGQSDTLSYHLTSRWFQKVNLMQQGVVPTTTENTISTTTPSSGGGDNEHSFDNGAYYLRTKLDKNSGTIEFHARVKTLGWVGIGLSPNPNMTNADIVIGGVVDSNNSVYYTDMYATANSAPTPDNKTVSDWILVSASQDSPKQETTIVYRRSLKTGDTNSGQDFEIKDQDLYLLWAYGTADSISYHLTKRGYTKVNLFTENTVSTTPNSAAIFPYSFVMPYVIFISGFVTSILY